jgi:hypothetical protein
MGMSMGVNPYPPAYMGNPVGLFLCREYGYGVVIPGGYLPIAISTPNAVGRAAKEMEKEGQGKDDSEQSGVSLTSCRHDS